MIITSLFIDIRLLARERWPILLRDLVAREIYSPEELGNRYDKIRKKGEKQS